ncbi:MULTISPECIES: type IV toxin-antitoxin system AbiEi family antitoxin domain-containing protein [Gammaproteobacteria]|uniref:type IV toxin-antitoxin system AbiEi family antitoxin domain-containing protein n=1 Tax=Gammaproteobacteria TaxID=1236 RepID=UPI00289A0DB3|nr:MULTISPECIES: type IV toxin-antitoxin system AbiEi family antitoxin [Gammaproteobacteria]
MRVRLSDVLSGCERAGKLNVHGEELRAKLPEASPEALRKALYRQQRAGRVVRLSRGSDHWLIVPLQYATSGSPPLEAWLDAYLRKTLETPYYVGLLSAAETYGASPYAVMVTQVIVETKRRPITVGRHKLVFHTCSRIEAMPTRWHQSSDGRFKVSTPELTALDVIQRDGVLGGMSRVREVLRGLWPHCTAGGLVEALDAVQSVPAAQRLGALLTLDGQGDLLASLSEWLRGRPMRLIALEGALPRGGKRMDPASMYFKVWIGAQKGANA